VWRLSCPPPRAFACRRSRCIAAAWKLARDIVYEQQEAVLSIDDAIARNSFFDGAQRTCAVRQAVSLA
jgi:hypothetical protein